MKNKNIKLFDDVDDKEIDNDLFEENKTKNEGELEKLLQETDTIGSTPESMLNSNPSKDLSDKSIFTFDNDEWNTMGKA